MVCLLLLLLLLLLLVLLVLTGALFAACPPFPSSFLRVQTGIAYGVWSREYFEALTRNAHEKAMYRIQPKSEQDTCIAWMKPPRGSAQRLTRAGLRASAA